VKDTTTPAPSAARGRYGLHWWLNAGDATETRQRSYPDLPRDLFAANGFQGQRLVIIPSRQLTVVRLGCTKVESRLSEAALLGRVLAALP
jgi:CubicO group peptidase (beta-lactamase class C family)